MHRLETFLAILNDPPPFEDDNDKVACLEILKTCFDTKEESEAIACTSYAYWIVSTKAPDNLPDTAKINAALKEIRRHYIGEGRVIDKAVEGIKAALEYRREYRVDILRSCFYEDNYDSNSDTQLANKYKCLIFQDLERQATVVEGVDSNDRTIVYKPLRTSNPPDADEAFLLTQLYTAERAIAQSEFTGKKEKLCVIFNFQNYSSRNSPSKMTLVTLVKVLQTCYPERLGILTVLEPPFWMRAIFNIVWPFLSRATADKIRMSQDFSEELLQDSSSHKKLREKIAQPQTSHVDLEEYTQRPFYNAGV